MRATPLRSGLSGWLLATLLAGMAFTGAGSARAEPPGALASPMVDPGIFRDGQVQRYAGRFDAWTAVCDDVKGLGRRFCSLRSAVARDPLGRTVSMDVSTGDDGRPAALLHLPLGISLRPGIVVGTAGEAGSAEKRAQGDKAAALPIAVCSSAECLAIWTPTLSDIAALNRGARIDISYCSLKPAPFAFRPSLSGGGCGVRTVVPIAGVGFGKALLAAVRSS